MATVRRTQQERTAESARRLLDAAIGLIAERGFERTTAAEIGERAGYSRSMVRVRYGSKEELLEALFGGAYRDRLLEAPPEAMPGIERALHPLTLMADAATADPRLLRSFFVLVGESMGPVDSLTPGLARWFADLERSTADALRAGAADGSVDAELEIRPAAGIFVTHVIGLGVRWTLDPEAVDFARIALASAETLRRRWQP